MNRSLPTRSLSEHPNLEQLKRQAKELLRAFISGEALAVMEVNAHFPHADPAKFALHDAQFVIARAYGFPSWPKLKAHVDGITLEQLVEAVRADDLTKVRALLKVRPELAHMSMGNLQVLHHAVLNRSPEMVRILMQHGAGARQGVYPHREATSPLTIAAERQYDEIVAVIKKEERRRREARSGTAEAPAPEALFAAVASGDEAGAITMLNTTPALVHTANPEGWTPLHAAARALNTALVGSLLDLGATAGVRGPRERTPLDLAAHFSSAENFAAFTKIASLLLGRGAALTAPAAVALGDGDWLRARYAEGVLVNVIEDTGGLLRIAASHSRTGIVALLLDFGFDPDERTRFAGGDEDSVVFTWGMPLWHCASTAKYDMAEMLLQRGADPNAEVYASGTPLYQAYGRRDSKMVDLLQRYGGRPNATVAGLYRQTELAQRLVSGTAGDPRADGVFESKPLGEELLSSGACGGDPEIVRMALELVHWQRDDPRWFGVLEQPLRMWNHGHGQWSNHEFDRGSYLTCFRLILEHCDANVRGRTTDQGQFGLTILHSVAASREHVTPEERIAFATALLDAGARVDLRDNLLESTPLGWACRWGRIELVKLLLERGADPVEADAEPWAAPKAWAQKMGHDHVLTLLLERRA